MSSLPEAPMEGSIGPSRVLKSPILHVDSIADRDAMHVEQIEQVGLVCFLQAGPTKRWMANVSALQDALLALISGREK